MNVCAGVEGMVQVNPKTTMGMFLRASGMIGPGYICAGNVTSTVPNALSCVTGTLAPAISTLAKLPIIVEFAKLGAPV